MSVRLLYGDNVHGDLVCVTAVPSGLACGLTCPACASPLIARKGNIRVHHLAHHARDSQCIGAVETVTHRLAKDVLQEGKRLTLPGLEISTRRFPNRPPVGCEVPPRDCVFDTVAIEYPIGGMRLDALVSGAVGALAVEFKVSHEVTPDKIGRLRAAGLVALEIDLSAYCRWDTPRQAIAEAVAHNAPRHWLTLPTIYAGEMTAAWEQLVKLNGQPAYLDKRADANDLVELLRHDPTHYERTVAEFENHPWYRPPTRANPRQPT